jgi:tellurite resistance protein TehA-like permease
MANMNATASNNPAMTAPASQNVPPPPPSPPRNGSYGSRSSSQSTTNTQIDNPASPSPTHDSSSYRTPNKHDLGWRRIVRNFSPSWFSVTMGTGIVSVIFISIPYPAHWLTSLSLTFFILNALLFSLAFLTSVLRYTLYPEIWTVMIQDPINSLFLGTIPMGFATLIEGWVFLLVPHWGTWARYVAWGAWMLDAIVAFGVTAFLSWNLLSQERTGTSLSRITAAQLLPIAATLVAAGTGAEVCEVLPGKERQLGTLLTCYVMWGAGMPLALTVIVVYYQRLAVHKLPASEIIVSSFLPLGPLGFGGYG